MSSEKSEPVGGCRHNPSVNCMERKNCAKCGWNPEVLQRRLEKILWKLREEGRI